MSRNIGLVTWIGIILVILILVIYYKGAGNLALNFSNAFGHTARVLTGQNITGTGPIGYAK